MRATLIAMLTAAAAAAGAGDAAAQQAEDRAAPAAIEVAKLGGIRDWRATGSPDALLVEGRNGRWYRATFMNDCPQIHFSNELAFVTDPTGDLTAFSSVIADGRRCYFESFERTSAPGTAEAMRD